MQEKLEKAVEEFKVYSERASSLFNKTIQCLEEMKTQDKLSEDAIDALSSSLNMEEIKQALKKRPSVVFIGNRNCGKSAILNELLGGSFLPVHETPCTSRIVRIGNSAGQNTVRVVDKAGEEVQPLTTFTKRVPKEYVVVCDEGREQSEQLKCTVEITLNHPFLKSGIELIDSPGKNENDALDDVVDTFFEKGITPLVVYVIDGNEQLRSSDRDTIRFLQDKYPQLSFMFVCNKVDTSAGAESHDTRSSDELDSDEEETVTKADKQKIVFSQLQHHGLIADNESYDTCSSFHGISAQNVREDRRKNNCSMATDLFSKFEDGLLGILEETIKRQTKQVVGKLVFLQMSLVQAMGRSREALPRMFGSPLEFDTAKSVEKSLHATLTETVASEEKIGMLVNCSLLNLEEKFMLEELQLHTTMQVSPVHELEARLINLLLVNENRTFSWNKEDAPFLRFLIVLKGLILDRTFNELRRVFEGFLNRAKHLVKLHSRNIFNPLLRQAFDVAYGSDQPKTRKNPLPDKTSLELFVLLRTVISKVLREVLSEVVIEGLLHAMEWKSSNAGFNLADKQTRRKIVELIVSKFSPQRITHSISVACTKVLDAVHNAFLKVVDDLNGLNDLVSNNWSQQLEEMAALYIPTVRHLVVQGFALQFLLKNGPLTLGPALKSTKHGTIHECTGWAGEEFTGEFVVKVIEEEKVEAEVWAQTAVDLINTMEIQTRIDTAHPNLLFVHGWLIPEPGVLHVLTEKADSDLTTALQEGRLPLKSRLKIAVDVADGLKAIHNAHYIHQDVKADSILLMEDGTAKINMAKPEKPFERTRQGTPFHISLEMHKNHGKGQGSDCSYDIYAFGILLWVLCEGSGKRRPQAYDRYTTVAAMKLAVEKEIYPERPVDATEACWELMTKCWRQRCVLATHDVCEEIEHIFRCTL
ncbi:hypothetical protein ACROYT_G001129 [Oculina patagonica]